MSDIDFDELDKAVNNLMSNVDTRKRNEGLDDPEVKTVTLDAEPEAPLPPEVAALEAPKPSTEVIVPSAPVAPAPTSTPALAVKRRGQFMDVMHPSSDMKTAKPVKREGVGLSPASSDVTPAPVASVPTPAEELAVQAPTSPESAVDTAPEQSPLTSPFLPDAKPEKRPLGAASDIAPQGVDIAAALDSELAAEASEGQVVSSPEKAPALPAELHTDVLALEAVENTAAEPIAAIEQPEALAATVNAAEQSEPPLVEEPAAVPAGGSIPQQYTEAPSSGDQTNGSIYDTSNYHQPIEAAPAAKKSSPLKWVLLAIGLLVLGGGGGIAYFLLTHQL